MYRKELEKLKQTNTQADPQQFQHTTDSTNSASLDEELLYNKRYSDLPRLQIPSYQSDVDLVHSPDTLAKR
jgi:hypothetical protein